MATVPTSFVPQVQVAGEGGQVPLQAPVVEPMRNYAPEQQIKMGEATERVGRVAYSIADSMQDDIDEAAAKEAVIKFSSSANEIMSGQNGYLNLSGKDAETGFQGASELLSRSANDTVDSMANGTQKEMVRQVLARQMVELKGQANNHRSREAKVYDSKESLAYIQLNISRAINDTTNRKDPASTFQTSSAAAFADLEKFLRKNGVPGNSQQAQLARNGLWSQLATGVVDRLSLENDFIGAKEYVDRQIELGQLDEETASRLTTRIDAGRDRQEIAEAARSVALMGSSTTPSVHGKFESPAQTGGTSEVIRGSGKDAAFVRFQVQPGSPILSPSSGVVKDIVRDENGMTMTIQFPGGNEAKISGLNDPYVHIGDNVKSGQRISDAGKFPVEYRMWRNGESIDPRAASDNKPSKDKDKIQPMEPLRDQLARVDREYAKDPEKAEAIKTKMIHDRNQADAVAADIARQNLADVETILATPYDPKALGFGIEYNGNTYGAVRKATLDDIPQPMLDKLTPQQLAGLKADRLKETSLEIRELVERDPSVLNDVFIEANRDKITVEDRVAYRGAIRDREERLKTEAGRLALNHEQIDRDMLNKKLLAAGRADLVNPKKGDAAAYSQSIEIRDRVNARLDDAKMEMGRMLTRDEQRGILDDVFLATVDVEQSLLGIDWLWPDKEVPAILLDTQTDKSAYVTVRGSPQKSDGVISGAVSEAERITNRMVIETMYRASQGSGSMMPDSVRTAIGVLYANRDAFIDARETRSVPGGKVGDEQRTTDVRLASIPQNQRKIAIAQIKAMKMKPTEELIAQAWVDAGRPE